jgi:IPT/TIG domain
VFSVVDDVDPVISYVFPRSGSIFGGSEVLIGGVCKPKTRDGEQEEKGTIVCKFGGTDVLGERQGDNAVLCIAPPLAGEGQVVLKVSADGGLSFPFSSIYTYGKITFQILRKKHVFITSSQRKYQSCPLFALLLER